jgi:uncharacterized protein YunC (DUF1805 family)
MPLLLRGKPLLRACAVRCCRRLSSTSSFDWCGLKRHAIPGVKRPLLAIVGAKGFAGCGYFNTTVCTEKTGDAFVKFTGVDSHDDFLCNEVVDVSASAEELGVYVGMGGRECLELLRGSTVDESLELEPEAQFVHLAPSGDWWCGSSLYAAKHNPSDYVRSVPLPAGTAMSEDIPEQAIFAMYDSQTIDTKYLVPAFDWCGLKRHAIPGVKRPLLAIVGAKGFAGCGYFNTSVCTEKTGDAFVKFAGVDSHDDFLCNEVVDVSASAEELGVYVGMGGRECLELLR